MEATLSDLQVSVQDRRAFHDLNDYITLCCAYLEFLESTRPTRIVSPTHHNYIFYQYDEAYYHRITRPLNANLFIEDVQAFRTAFDRFSAFLDDLKRYQDSASKRPGNIQFVQSNEIKLDGIYYVDPRPEMTRNERLREQIADFQRFLVRDIWILSR